MPISRRHFLAAIPAALTADRLSAALPKLPAGARDMMLKELGKPDTWTAAKAVGAEIIEVMVDDQFNLPQLAHPERQYTFSTQAGIDQLAADLKSSGIRVSAFLIATKFDSRPDFEIDCCAKLARIAQHLGAKAIRIDVASPKMTPDQLLEAAVPALKKVIAATENTGVSFGVENHSRIANDPAFLTPLLDRVGSKRLGVTLDTGNFYWFGNPLSKVYELIETFAPRVVHTHCKNIAYPEDQREARRPMGWEYAKYAAPIDQGDIDFTRVIKILRAAGYSGDLCVENEALRRLPEADREPILAKEVAYLKRLRA